MEGYVGGGGISYLILATQLKRGRTGSGRCNGTTFQRGRIGSGYCNGIESGETGMVSECGLSPFLI